MKVKFSILFPASMYIGDDSEPTRMKVKNIKAFKRVTGVDLKTAKEFVESCERDYDLDYGERAGTPSRVIILTAKQWGMLSLLREDDQCSFHAHNVKVLDYEDGHDVTDFTGGATLANL